MALILLHMKVKKVGRLEFSFEFINKTKFLVLAVGVLLPLQFGLSEVPLIHLSPNEVHSLQEEFGNSSTPPLSELDATRWNCTLFGVRSRLQRQHDIELFRFKKKSKTRLQNRGSHIISSYENTANGLVGESRDPDLLEELRVHPSGHLLSRIHFRQPELPKNQSTIAYSKCRAKVDSKETQRQ